MEKDKVLDLIESWKRIIYTSGIDPYKFFTEIEKIGRFFDKLLKQSSITYNDVQEQTLNILQNKKEDAKNELDYYNVRDYEGSHALEVKVAEENLKIVNYLTELVEKDIKKEPNI